MGDANNGFKAYNHFGAGDVPMTAENFQTLQANGRSMLHIPFAIGAISFFHSIPSVPTDSGSHLNLTAPLLARVFQRNITTWDHADILAANPDLLKLAPGAAGQEIKVARRALGSSSTAGATQYLETSAPSDWVLGSGKTVNWPAGTNAVQVCHPPCSTLHTQHTHTHTSQVTPSLLLCERRSLSTSDPKEATE